MSNDINLSIYLDPKSGQWVQRAMTTTSGTGTVTWTDPKRYYRCWCSICDQTALSEHENDYVCLACSDAVD